MASSRQGSFKDYANMPIFIDDVNPVNAPASHALQSLQGYGSKLQTMGNFNRFSSGISPSFDAFSPQTGTSTGEPPVFESLNLNSVDEEDEFLYGDSSSLPEAPSISKEVKVETSLSKPNSGWSDEEDFYVEAVIPGNEGSNKNPFKWNIHDNKRANMPHKISASEISSNPVIRNVCLEKPSLGSKTQTPQRSVSASKGDLKLQVSIKNSDTVKNMPSAKVESKSKYHAAAEILKKQAIDKSKLKIKEGFTTDIIVEPLDKKISSLPVSNTEPTAKRTVILPKNSKKISLDPISANIAKSHIKGDLRRPAKHFFESDLTEVGDSFTDNSRKHSSAHGDYTHDLKAYQTTKAISSFHHISGASEAPRKRHSRSPSPRYSGHPSRSPSYGSSRYSSHRSRSPSFGSRFRKKSKSPSFEGHPRDPHHPRTRSPEYRYRHRSPTSRRRSPNEYNRQHYSRSPPKKSTDRSPMYHKHRSRSKSPRYHSPKPKHPETDSEKLIKKTETSIKMEPEFRSSTDASGDSTFGSNFISSDKLQDRGDVLKSKNLRLLEMHEEDLSNKTIKVENPQSMFEDVAVSKAPDIPCKVEPIVHEEPENDVFKSLNEEEKKMLTMYNQLESMDFITELLRTQQSNTKFDEPVHTAVGAFPNDGVGVNVYGVPSEQDPSLSYPQMFPFNPVPPSMPLQLPNVNVYPGVASLPVVPPPEAYSYPPIVMNVHPPAVALKQSKLQKSFRPNLRSIPVSDSISSQHSNLRNIRPAVSVFEEQKTEPLPNAAAKTMSDDNEIERVPHKVNSEKTDETEKTSKKLTAAEVRSKENRSSMLENFKKLKAARCVARDKVNRAVSDIIEMRNLIDQTWSKKNATTSEKVIYGKCKSVLATSTDIMNKYIKEAKHCDEELSRFKDRMPADLQSQAAKLKPEDYLKEPEASLSDHYILFDPGKHSCYSCNKQLMNIAAMMNHLHSSEHQENVDSSEKEWIEEFRKKTPNDSEKIKNGTLHPVQGIEFIKPTTGFFCTLCKEYCFDSEDAETHLKGTAHLIKYKTYLKENPLYDSKCLVKRLVKYSVCSKEKAKRESSEMEKKSLKRKKNNDAADEKAKKILKNELSKVFDADELEEEDSTSIEVQSPKNDGIKLNLSNDKDKSKQIEAKKSSKDSKAAQRVVYIGKAPNFKGRSKPWYKRESYSENKGDTSASSCTDIMEKLKEKISTLPLNKPSTVQTSEQQNSSPPSSDSKTDSTTSKKLQEVKSKESVKDNVKEKEKETNEEFVGPLQESASHKDSLSVTSNSKGLSKIDTVSGKDVKSSKYGKHENLSKKSGVRTAKEKKSKINDPVVKRALSNILYGTDSSSRPPVSLSEITLPKKHTPDSVSPLKISVPCKSNTEIVPMEISPTKEDVNRPKTEEEKDFFILGINKDDMKPLAIPIPPPMLNYYSPGSSNVAPSVPPTHIIKNVPPPSYDINAANISYIPTNVPPPGYNVNAMNSSVHPMVPCNTAMQGPPTMFPTNIPPPGYNASSGIPTHTSGTHYPSSRPSVPVMQSSSGFSPPKSKKKLTANTNLITISPTTNMATSDSSSKKKISSSPQQAKDGSLKSHAVASKTDVSSDSKASESSKERNIKIAHDDSKITSTTEIQTETGKSARKSKDLEASKSTACEVPTVKESIVETSDVLKTTKGLKQAGNILAHETSCTEKVENHKKSGAADPLLTLPECKENANTDKEMQKENLFSNIELSVTADIVKNKLDEIVEDITVNRQTESECWDTAKWISEDKNNTNEISAEEQGNVSESNVSSVPSSSGPASATDNKFAGESLMTEKNSFAENNNKESVQMSVGQLSLNDSIDNAESVFNYQAFEKLEALTQSSEDSTSENSRIKEKLISSDTDQFAPPVLMLENSESYERSNRSTKKSDELNFSLETSDSNLCAPPVLELEVFKGQDTEQKSADALKLAEGFSDSNSSSHCATANKDTFEIPEISSIGEKENSSEPFSNAGAIGDLSSNFLVETVKEPCFDVSDSFNSRDMTDDSKMDMMAQSKDKDVSATMEQVTKLEPVNNQFPAENSFINMMDKSLKSEISEEKETEKSVSHDGTIKTETEGNEAESVEEKNEVYSVEPDADDAYGSDTETDEYENENI